MKSHLQFNAEELEIVSDDGRRERLAWDSVLEVFAFKDDVWAYDIICLGFRLDAEGTYFKIDEEHSAYKELVDALPKIFPGIREDWFSDVAFPAFEPCLTTIWGEPVMNTLWKKNAEQGGAPNTYPRHASCCRFAPWHEARHGQVWVTLDVR